MKQGIHPEYVETKVTCSCGNVFTTRSVKPELHVELCNKCHPFYTGKQKLVDTGGRVERFQRKYARRAAAPSPAAEEGDRPSEAPAEQ
ncbi:MAG: 50S ribosomal protein L31 [Actinomycetota bacterium]